MNETQPNNFYYKESIQRLEQAIFFCFDEFNNKIPVGLITSFFIDEEYNIWFNITRLPMVHQLSTNFDGQLSFHKKGELYHLNITGTANITDKQSLLVKFSIIDIECIGELAMEENSVQTKIYGFLKSLLTPYSYIKKRVAQSPTFF